MEDMTWTIVQFIEDLTVEAIPTAWIQGDHCHWPPYKLEKLTTAIRKCEALNTCWPRHAIKMFRNATFDEYTKARTKARIAEDCSDLNSENEPSGKRKRIAKMLSSSSSSEDSIENSSFVLPAPPKLSKELVSSYKIKNNSFNSSQSVLDDSFGKNINNDLLNLENKSSAVPKTVALNSTSAVLKTLKDKNENQLVSASSSGCCLQHENTILMDIKNQNHMIRSILVDLLNEVKELKKSNIATLPCTNSLFVKYPDIKFPIGSDDELNKFEEELKIELNFNEAVDELAKFGGSNPYDFIKRTLSSLIRDIMLIKYSWLGRKGKRRLENSVVAKLLIRAADKCLSSNQKDIEKAIQSFIKRSGERLTAKENKKTN